MYEAISFNDVVDSIKASILKEMQTVVPQPLKSKSDKGGPGLISIAKSLLERLESTKVVNIDGLFTGLLILNVEEKEDRFIYTAHSECFDRLKPGETIPFYTCIIHSNERQAIDKIEWKRDAGEAW
jgi:hypothetical protein